MKIEFADDSLIFTAQSMEDGSQLYYLEQQLKTSGIKVRTLEGGLITPRYRFKMFVKIAQKARKTPKNAKIGGKDLKKPKYTLNFL